MTTDAPESVQALVDEQAEDDGLWFIAETAPEAYLQQELRRLHAAVESAPDQGVSVELIEQHVWNVVLPAVADHLDERGLGQLRLNVLDAIEASLSGSEVARP